MKRIIVLAASAVILATPAVASAAPSPTSAVPKEVCGAAALMAAQMPAGPATGEWKTLCG